MEKKKNLHAVMLGRLGGKAGGLRKWFESLTPEQKRAHQQKAIRARWNRERALKSVNAPLSGEGEAKEGVDKP